MTFLSPGSFPGRPGIGGPPAASVCRGRSGRGPEGPVPKLRLRGSLTSYPRVIRFIAVAPQSSWRFQKGPEGPGTASGQWASLPPATQGLRRLPQLPLSPGPLPPSPPGDVGSHFSEAPKSLVATLKPRGLCPDPVHSALTWAKHLICSNLSFPSSIMGRTIPALL